MLLRMAKKDSETKQDHRKYDLKIPYEFYKVIKKYIEEKKDFGYSNVSQFLNELIRNEIKRILQEQKQNDN